MPTQLLPIGPPTVITQSVIYALPAKLVSVTTSAACETSVDQTTWAALTSGSNTSASFIRCTSASPTVTCKAASSGGGEGGSLPTAPIGQVLISQGAGVPPVFSNQFTLYNPTAPVDLRKWAVGIANDGNFIVNVLNDAGVPLNPKVVIDPYSGGIASVYGSLFVLNGAMSGRLVNFVSITLADAAAAYQGTVGNVVNISDSTTSAPGAVIVGGGALNVLARWNGIDWRVIQ